jgi:sirohydrochlorin ferrochelatase
MRHSRLSGRQHDGEVTAGPGTGAPLVAVAHGSRDPRAAATVTELLSVVRARAAARSRPGGLDVRAAFLENWAPSLPQVLGSLPADGTAGGHGGRTAIVVPLLLTAAYHSKTDIPAQLAAAREAAGQDMGSDELDVRCTDTLGPHPLLTDALERRLREAGVRVGRAADRAATSVVLAAAGSSDPAANATIADLATAWQRDRGWQAVVPAYASAATPTPAQAVGALRRDGARRVVVATYLLAPGYFADKIRASTVAAGASAVSAVLGAAPEVADVILARYAAASRLEWSPSETSYAERTVATPQLVTCSIRGDHGERILRRVRRAAKDLTR